MKKYSLQGSVAVLLFLFFHSVLGFECPTFGFFSQIDQLVFWGDKVDFIENKNNFRNGLNIPRTRFFVRGRIQDWYYDLSYDVAEKLLRDVFLRYDGNPHFRFYIGQYKVPYSFWFMARRKEAEFLEFALPALAFNPGYRVGLQPRFIVDPLTLSVSLFGPTVENRVLNNQVKGRIPMAVNARITFAPVHQEKKVLHFAAAGVIQGTDSLGRFGFRASPEVRTSPNHFLVNTGFFYECKNYIGEELEAAIIFNSLFCLGEYYHIAVNRYTQNLYFHGGMISLGYFLTGEHYVYDFKDGTVTGISKIRHSFGALQLDARYSTIDLMSDAVLGGYETNLTLGLDWILNKHVKFTLNYINADADPSCNGLNRKLNILALRFQLAEQSY